MSDQTLTDEAADGGGRPRGTPMCSHREVATPSAAELLEVFGGRDGRIASSTLLEHRHAVVAHTGIDAIPYSPRAIDGWLKSGGEQRVLAALAEAAADEPASEVI